MADILRAPPEVLHRAELDALARADRDERPVGWALFGLGVGFGTWYFVGVAAAAAILLYEHSLVRAGDLSRLDAAFFTMNAVMSATVLGFALLDRVLR